MSEKIVVERLHTVPNYFGIIYYLQKIGKFRERNFVTDEVSKFSSQTKPKQVP